MPLLKKATGKLECLRQKEVQFYKDRLWKTISCVTAKETSNLQRQKHSSRTLRI